MWLLLVSCVVLSYGALYSLGSLFMRLVLVQAVERRSARFGFASCFAVSVSLLATALCSAAMEGGHFVWLHRRLFACGDGDGVSDSSNSHHAWRRTGHSSCSHRTQTHFFYVLFQCYLALVLLHVLLVCPLLLLRLVTQRVLDTLPRPRRGGAHTRRVPHSRDAALRAVRRLLLRRVVVPCVVVAAVLMLLSRRERHAGYAAAHAVVTATTRRVRACARALLVATAHAVHVATTLLRLPSEVPLPPSTPSAWPGRVQSDNVRSTTTTTTATTAVAVAAGAGDADAVWAQLSPPTQLLCLLTARVATLGVALAGLLAGYAAYMTPYSYCVPYVYWATRETRVRHALQLLTRRQHHVLQLYAAKQRRIAHETYMAAAAAAATTTATRSVDALPAVPCHDDVYARARHDDDNDDDKCKTHTTVLQRVRAVTRRLVARTSSPRPRSSRASATAARVRDVRRVHAHRVAPLRVDAESTRQLSLALFLESDRVERLLVAARDGQTRLGAMYALFGAGLACYAALMLLCTSSNLVAFRATAARDAVTTAVELLERAFILRPRDGGTPHRYNDNDGDGDYNNKHDGHTAFSVTTLQASAQVMLTLGLLLQAWMLISSLRGLLLLLFRLTVSSSAVVAADATALLFAMLMGVYALSQLVLLRPPLALLLPPVDVHDQHGSCNNITSSSYSCTSSGERTGSVLHLVLGVLPVHYYQRLNDCCFVISLVVTALLQRVLYAESTLLAMDTLLLPDVQGTTS